MFNLSMKIINFCTANLEKDGVISKLITFLLQNYENNKFGVSFKSRF